MQTQHRFGINPFEQAGYFDVSGVHLYTVLHEVPDPIGRVLLVGSFASERHFSYIPWVRWARYLAERGIECLRYDYRGIGESTGVFEDLSFENWTEDVELLAAWLKARSPDVPLILHGLEVGALLAGKVFEAGTGEGLLLWAAPASANQALRATLLRRIAMDNAFKYGPERKAAADYFHQIESNEFLEVEGYRWSAKLWRDSFNFELPAGISGHSGDITDSGRPVRAVELSKHAAPLVRGSSDAYEAINKDFNALYAESLEWISAALGSRSGRSN